MNYISVLKPNFNIEYWLLDYYINSINCNKKEYLINLIFSIYNNLEFKNTHIYKHDLIDTILLLTDNFEIKKNNILTTLFEELFIYIQNDNNNKNNDD